MVKGWTVEGEAALLAMWVRGAKMTAIGKRLGVPAHVIRYKIQALRAQGRIDAAAAKATPRGTDWPADRVAALRRAWGEGLSRPAIALALGVSRGAVIGKLQRLAAEGLLDDVARQRAQATRGAPKAARPVSPERRAAALERVQDGAGDVFAVVPPAARARATDGRGCQWPHGDPRTAAFHFCGAAAAPGRPYCADHCAVAYRTEAVDAGAAAKAGGRAWGVGS